MKIRFQIKDKKPILFLIIILLLSVVGTTFAYFYSEVVIPNQFKTMTYHVVLTEESTEQWGNHNVTISNLEETNVPVAIRIQIDESWTKAGEEGISLVLNNKINGENVVTKTWTNDFINDFAQKDDGWYYYKKKLNAQQSIQILQSIALNQELINTSPNASDYQEYNYNLSFNMEAVQATKNAISKIWSQNVAINGDNITW